MTLRITEIHRVLKPTGSFYLHCDPSASHYLKLVLDAIFCSQGGDFLNEIIWCYGSGGASKYHFSKKHDVILYYCKSNNKFIFNVDLVREPYSSPEKVENKIINGKAYQRKHELGRIPFDWWQIPILTNTAKERLGYPTQKPEALLERIIKASSNVNDVILDAYCGCGTTVAVSQRLERQWIGIDITYQSISLILKRLEDSFGSGVLETINLHGIPKDMESATALANKADDRTRKEFEKWAILTYTNNRAVINTKKGADKGIDGIAYFQGDKDEPEKILFQVKSGKVKSGDIRDLLGTMTLQDAKIGIFITLETPSREMLKTAKATGFYQSKYYSTHSFDKIQIVTVKDIIENQERLNIRLTYEVVKSAEKQKEVKVTQTELDI